MWYPDADVEDGPADTGPPLDTADAGSDAAVLLLFLRAPPGAFGSLT